MEFRNGICFVLLAVLNFSCTSYKKQSNRIEFISTEMDYLYDEKVWPTFSVILNPPKENIIRLEDPKWITSSITLFKKTNGGEEFKLLVEIVLNKKNRKNTIVFSDTLLPTLNCRYKATVTYNNNDFGPKDLYPCYLKKISNDFKNRNVK